MLKVSLTLLAIFLPLATSSGTEDLLSVEKLHDGWITLFDGETLFGWQPASDANWRVEDGTIRVDSGDEGWLMTTAEFADYELHVEFNAPEATNSGVFLRTLTSPTDPTQDCYEVNIAPTDNPFPTGSLVGRQRTRETSTSARSTSVGRAEPWHTLQITVNGPSITVELDGHEVTKFNDPHSLHRGRIGLQFREGAIAFRNIYLKPLNLKPLFNGTDLSGWNTDHANQSKFTVTDAGEIQVINGPGQLESDNQYGDFLLQLDCKVNGDRLNSGIFFRCIPGDQLMGYESQIQNGMVDGDPTRPQDCGTGGIYRRVNARRIVARDHEWFAKTILATGPRVSVWVNGYQVTDWTDDRPANENPRRGLRLEPGTLAIQGHDPTTNLLFRRLRIVELPEPAR